MMDKQRDTNDEIRTTSQSGQVAVILILITAMALIYYAVSLNFGRMSQAKTLTTIASDTSAAFLASGMAGYGQALSESNLEGRRHKCDYTPIWAAITGLVIAIVMIVLTWGTAAGPALAIFAAIVSAVSLAVQITVVQPALSDKWNRLMNKAPISLGDKMIENALRGAMQKVLTDSAQVPDLYDEDGDRVWETNPANVPPADTISRFSVYYAQRMERIAPIVGANNIGNFRNALRNFVYEDGDGWGLFDPYLAAGPGCALSAECDPCCVPDSATVYGQLSIDIRPADCDPGPVAGWAADCGGRSPYGAAYPWVYDPFFEEALNGFFSFREQIGRDDEHQLFSKNSADPNGTQVSILGPPPPLPPNRFQLADTTSYYPADPKAGVFPFLYKVADWGVDLSGLQIGAVSEHCYWSADAWDGGLCPMSALPAELNVPLVLPNDPLTLSYNRNAFVDNISNNTPGAPPLAPDKVTFPGGIIEDDGLTSVDLDGNGTTPDPVCSQQALFNTTNAIGFWRKGGDRFCAVDGTDADGDIDWPYYAVCPKHVGSPQCQMDGEDVDCQCNRNGTLSQNFPDDVLDDIVYGLPEFIAWARGLLTRDVTDLAGDFMNWYPQAATWIEPGTAGPPTGSNAVVNGMGIPSCFSETCKGEDGYLHIWRKEIEMMRSRLEGWKTVSYQGSGVVDACRQVWCAPPVGCSLDTPSTEAATFDSNGNGVWGDINDVIACLDYNVNYPSGGALCATECQTCDTPCRTTRDSCIAACAGDTACITTCRTAYTACYDACVCPSLGSDCSGWAGNAQRFRTCYLACLNCANADNCASVDIACGEAGAGGSGLPRSLIPGFSPNQLYATDPPNGALVSQYKQCRNECNTCKANCDTTYNDCINLCNSTAPPCTVAEQAACLTAQTACYNTTCATCSAGNGGYACSTDFNLKIQNAKGVCTNPFFMGDGVPGAPDGLLESIPEAQNQVAKFNQRMIFLQNRLAELDNTLGILGDAKTKFDGFLDGPAAALIQERITYGGANNSGLPFQMIYGWLSDPVPGDVRGRWHIVKVEARLPGECDGACNTAQDPDPTIGDPAWPWIHTETNGWASTERCFELRSTSGVVKFRTTRFDENRGSSVLFPNGVPLWDFKYFHPNRPVDYSSSNIYNPEDLDMICGGSMIDTLRNGNPAGGIYEGAFMLNESGDNPACWNRVHAILTRGVVSERCAEYYWHEGANPGMGFRFVPCRNF